MSNRSCFFVVLAVLAGTQTGCRTIPDYHQPAGFSSTYHQRIYPETAYAALSDASSGAKVKDPGVFYPTDVKVKQPKYVAPLAEIRDRISDEDLSNERKQLQLDSLKRTDNYINQEPFYNQNFSAPGNW